MSLKTPVEYGRGISLGDIEPLLKSLGYDFRKLRQRADALKIKRTRHIRKRMRSLEQQMHRIGRETEFAEIWSKLFSEKGDLKFWGVTSTAAITGVSPSTVRRRIAKGELSAVKGYRQLFIDTRKLSSEAAA
jgi:hypothetical protein